MRLLPYLVVVLAVCAAGCATSPAPASAPPPPPRRLLSDEDIAALAPREPTFSRHVAPIVFSYCASCHRPGEVAPFSLLSYEDVVKHAEQVERVTRSRFMPPWKPVAGYGEFLDDQGLTDEQIATLSAWVKAGMPRGEPAEEPELPKFTEGWKLGQPDLVVKLPVAYEVPAEGEDVYRCFVIPTGFLEDKQVAALEFRPGNRQVVHHMLTFLDTKGAARKRDEEDPGPGYQSFGGPGFTPQGQLGGWAPGAMPRMLPEGTARLVPKGSDLVIQMHYSPTGKPEVDQSEVGIYFARTPTKKWINTLPLLNPGLTIAPGAERHREAVAYTLPVEIELVGVVPHMHLLGKEMRAWATLPDGSVRPLVWIDDWDFNWQGQYTFKEPVELPKGTRLEFEAYYDNSEENPFNPSNPPRRVTWGEQTTDEMALIFFAYATERPEDRQVLLRELVMQLGLWRFIAEINR